MTEKQGSGEKLGNIGPIEVFDDGFGDGDVKFRVNDMSKTRSFSAIRTELGDDRLQEILSGDQSVSSDDFEPREPPAFVCQQCNLTWPRSKNNGDDICPKCR